MIKKTSVVILIFGILIFVLYINSNKHLEINTDVQRSMNEMGMEDSVILKFCGIEDINKRNIIVAVTEEEVEKRLNNILLDNAYRERISDRTVVHDGDLVIADYDVYYNQEIINSVKNEPIKVGSGYYDEQLERELVGLDIREKHVIKWIVPQYTSEKLYSGKQFKIDIRLNEIYNVKIPTQEEYAEMKGFADSDELIRSVYDELIEEKKNSLLNKEIDVIIDDLISKSKFSISENEVKENAVGYYYDYFGMSNIYGIDIESYVKNMVGYSGDIYLLCYEESKKEIERYLIIGIIARIYSIHVLDEDVNEFLLDNNIGKISEEELSYIKYVIIEQKVFQYLQEELVSIEIK